MNSAVRNARTVPAKGTRGRRLGGRATSAVGIGGLAAVTMVTDERNLGVLLVAGVVGVWLNLVIAIQLTAVTGRIALLAVKAGQDPIPGLRLLSSVLRATR